MNRRRGDELFETFDLDDLLGPASLLTPGDCDVLIDSVVVAWESTPEPLRTLTTEPCAPIPMARRKL